MRDKPLVLTRKAEYTLFTDGASRKDKRGGWGFSLQIEGKEILSGYGGYRHTTSARMEMIAAIKGLERIAPGPKIWVISDSKYLVDGITEYLDTWLRAGWRGNGNKPIKNKDLWERLGHLDCDHTLEWMWVKGHSGYDGNERADQLATLGVPKQRIEYA